jgi:hypothetical protein
MGAIVLAAGLLTAQADTVVTFSVDMGTNILNGTFVPGTDTISVHGSFNSWGAAVNLVQQGNGTVYTNTVDDTTDANGGSLFYKFVDSNAGVGSGGYENLCDSGGNRAVYLPTISGSSLVLPTPFFADSGAPITYGSTITFQVDMAQQINLSTFNPDTDTIQVAGKFNNWTASSGTLAADPTILRTNQFGLVTSNVYTGTFTSVDFSTNAHMAYKYVLNGNYGDNPAGGNNDGGGNRFFTMLPVDQTNPIVFYDDAPYAPIVTNLGFSVDMSIVEITDTNFNPASLTINGDLMGWGGVSMTNNPTAANTNIYTCTVSYSDGVGATVHYQYRYTLLNSPSSIVYDHANGANGGGGNRVVTIPNASNTNFLSVFNDASLDDYLLQPTAVSFSVDMANAVGTDGHAFSANSDAVYINGTFANWYTWSGGSNPQSAPGSSSGAGNAGGPYLMVEQGLGTIYTNTVIIPPGPVVLSYKYGLDPNEENGGPLDDEAASGLNHTRVIRSTAFNPYVMPQDKFGNQYVEPYFSSANTAGGDLTIGKLSAGTVPVQWLGRPGAHLQVKGSLTGATWQDLWVTDGTNWASGSMSTNGFVSQTNWPANGIQFFRLVKP